MTTKGGDDPPAKDKDEKEGENKEKKADAPPAPEAASLGEILSYMTGCQRALWTIGAACSILAGLSLPTFAIIFGEVVSTFDPKKGASLDQLMDSLVRVILTIAAIIWVFGYIQYALMQQAAEQLTIALRGRYLRCLLMQEVAYFEKNNVEQMPSDIGAYFTQINKGIGDAQGQVCQALGSFFGGFCIAFYYGPVLAIIALAFMPVFFFFMSCFFGAMKKAGMAKLEKTTELGGFTEECMNALKLIVSFAQEEHMIEKYNQKAMVTRDVSKKSNRILSAFICYFRAGLNGFFVYCYYIASVFMVGEYTNSRTDAPYEVVDIVSITQAMLMAMMGLFSLQSQLTLITQGKICAKKALNVITRVPEITDKKDEGGKGKVVSLEREINFDNVHFRYPTAPEAQPDTLQGVSFKIKAGTSTAIVGPSGSGKSTIVQMIERFYDPKQGTITMDGVNLSDFKLNDLRKSIGYVAQEPVLIIGTIKENLHFANKNATMDDMVTCLSKANAEFVQELENGVNTYVGSTAIQNLSGGQKQRLAIARALIKNPKILILDEATSALDPKSEHEVQAAIENIQQIEEKAGNKLTIIMIAHRLSTIETAQNLLYIDSSKKVIAVEKGTPEYDEILLKLKTETYKHQEGEQVELESPQKPKPGTFDNSRTTKVETASGAAPKEIKVSNDDQISEESWSGQRKKEQDEEEPEELEEDYTKKYGFFDIMKYYNPCLGYFSVFWALLNAMLMPLFGYFLGNMMFVIVEGVNSPTFVENRNYWVVFGLLLMVTTGAVVGLQKLIFAEAGEGMTYKVRTLLFREIIYKNVSWFDRKSRAPGILSIVFTEDIINLNGLSTELAAMIIETFFCLVFGIWISAAFQWRMTLVCVALTPLVTIGGLLIGRLQWKAKSPQKTMDKEAASEDPYDKSNALLSDVIMNYRTVVSFGQENVDSIIRKYDSLLVSPMAQRVKNAHLAGIAYGYSICTRFIYIGTVFYIASKFTIDYNLNPKDVFLSIYIIFVTAMGAGFAMSAIPSATEAKESAAKIFHFIEDKSILDVRDYKEGKIQKVQNGTIEFKNVTFNYPTRKQKVLNGFNMVIPAGRKIGLVGHSGCGKSTITNLLLRFYDIKEGDVLIDGKNISEYDISELRRQIGYVMQEPILFNATIKENILFGDLQAKDTQVRHYADMANALQFIESNYEELTQEEQIINMRNMLSQACQDRLKSHQLNQHTVERIKNLEGANDLIVLKILKETIENADAKFLQWLDTNVELFSAIVEKELLSNEGKATKSLRWDDLIIRCEWKREILDFVQESNIGPSEVLEQAMAQMPCQFDTMILSKLFSQGSPTKALSLFHLEAAINEEGRSFKERFGKRKQDRFKELHSKHLDAELELHKGFSKNCGLKGSKLSGGQKQRIAIARALIKEPKILILDEATSALDENSQEIVQQALDRAMEGRTSIVIAHRLSTIRNCELLFVIKDGVVVEQGTFGELSNDKDSYFNKLKAGMEM